MNNTDFRVVTPVAITDAMLISSTIAETDYGAWNSGTTYAAAARVIVTSSGVHKVYESLQAGNLNKDPTSAANSAWWAEVSPTNRWKMFDRASGTVSSDTTSIEVEIQPGRVDTLALLDVDAATARVRMSTTADGTFFDQSFTLTGGSDVVTDWYEYFYSEIGTKNALVVPNLPPIGDAKIKVTLTRTGGTVSLGSLVVGSSTTFGVARYGARAGITDYSRKTTDDFGRTTIVERAYAKRMNVSLLVEKARVDAVVKKLSALRATLSLWLAGTDGYEALQVYGWFKDFDVVLDGPYYSSLSLDIEGIA